MKASGVYTSTTTTTSVTISTTSSNDWIYAIVSVGAKQTAPGGPTTVPTGSSLGAFSSRCSLTASTTGVSVYTYYKFSSGALTSETITTTLTTTSRYLGLIVFAVSGADASNPFDRNLGSCPAGVTGTAKTTASVSATVSGVGDLIVGIIGIYSNGTPSTTPSGTRIVLGPAVPAGGPDLYQSDSEYTATETSGSKTMSFTVASSGPAVAWTVGMDAFVSTIGIPEFPAGVIFVVVAILVAYRLARTRRSWAPASASGNGAGAASL